MAQRKRQERIWNEKIEYNYVVVMQMERFNMEKSGTTAATTCRLRGGHTYVHLVLLEDVPCQSVGK